MLSRNSQLHTACYKRGVFLYLEYLVDESFKNNYYFAIFPMVLVLYCKPKARQANYKLPMYSRFVIVVFIEYE